MSVEFRIQIEIEIEIEPYPKSKGVSFPVTAYLIIWSLHVSRMKNDLFYY